MCYIWVWVGQAQSNSGNLCLIHKLIICWSWVGPSLITQMLFGFTWFPMWPRDRKLQSCGVLFAVIGTISRIILLGPSIMATKCGFGTIVGFLILIAWGSWLIWWDPGPRTESACVGLCIRCRVEMECSSNYSFLKYLHEVDSFKLVWKWHP